jgi:hypothetical protein
VVENVIPEILKSIVVHVHERYDILLMIYFLTGLCSESSATVWHP